MGFAPPSGVSEAFVVNRFENLDKKHSVKIATTTVLTNSPVSSGSGVGKTLTATFNGILIIDTVSTWTDIDNDGGVNDPFATSGLKASRILVKNQLTGSDNGIYVVKDKGSAGTPYVLVRAVDFDEDVEVTAAAYAFVEEGFTNADTGWLLTTNDPVTVDVTSQVWTSFTAAVGIGYTLSWGAALSSAGKFAQTNGLASSSEIAVFDPESEHTIPKGGTLNTISWNTASADATTFLKVHVNGVLTATVPLTGATGSAALPPASVSAGGEIAVEYDAGTAPAKSIIDIYIE